MNSIIKNIFFILIITFFGFNSYAVSLYDDDSLEHDSSSFVIPELNPFDMSSWYFRYGFLQKSYNPNKDNVTDPASEKLDEETKSNFLLMTVGMNAPLYGNYLHGGFNITANAGTLQKNSQMIFMSIDPTLSLKFTIPLGLGSAGNIGLYGQGDVGISLMMLDAEDLLSSKFEESNYDINDIKNVRFGVASGLSLGVEYYMTEWIGLSAGWQIKHYQFGRDNTGRYSQEDLDKMLPERREEITKSMEPYSKTISNILTIGLHITF